MVNVRCRLAEALFSVYGCSQWALPCYVLFSLCLSLYVKLYFYINTQKIQITAEILLVSQHQSKILVEIIICCSYFKVAHLQRNEHSIFFVVSIIMSAHDYGDVVYTCVLTLLTYAGFCLAWSTEIHYKF